MIILFYPESWERIKRRKNGEKKRKEKRELCTWTKYHLGKGTGGTRFFFFKYIKRFFSPINQLINFSRVYRVDEGGGATDEGQNKYSRRY